MHCHQINEKCFRKYDNHKTVEILCWESKNLKDKVIQLFKITRIFLSLYTALISVAAPMNRFQHRHFDMFAYIFLTYSFARITEPDFLPFLNASSAQKWKKTKIYKSEYRAGNITQWFCRAIKLCIISVKIYAAIMVKVTFEIKSNI